LPFCHLTLTAAKPKPYGYPVKPKTLGECLRKKRLDDGLLQRELAARLNVDEMAIVNWELNRTKPRPRAVRAIVDYLGYEPMATEPRKSAASYRFPAPHGPR